MSARRCTLPIAATLVLAATVAAPSRARADLTINIFATPPLQTIIEGQSGTITFDLFNASSGTAYIDTNTLVFQVLPAIGSPDTTDEIFSNGFTVAPATNGTLVAGTGIYKLGTTLNTDNLLEITFNFTSPNGDGETDGDFGINIVRPAFQASTTLNAAGTRLSDPTPFSFGAGNVTTQATVIVQDVPEPSALALLSLGGILWAGYRRRATRRNPVAIR